MKMQNGSLQTDMTHKTETARHFLEEALTDFQNGMLREAAEKMMVSGTLVREMIGFIKLEEMNRPVRVASDATFRHRPERHVMWYELKEKYLPELVQRNRPLPGEETVSGLPVKLTEENVQKEPPLLQAPIEELGLSTRSENCLRIAGIETVGQLAAKTENDLKMLRNFGQKCLAEVTAKMAEKNLFIRKEGDGEKT
jgi:hypothetical protein